jgi:flagellar hook-associated protein 2
MTISAINLGSSFTNSSGTTVLSGLASGINTQSAINSIVAAQSSQITTLNDQVTVNNGQINALNTLQTLLTELQTATMQLSDPQSPEASVNAFAAVAANITSNTSQPASNFITASAVADTPAGSYTISDISNLATATSQISSTFSVSPASTPIVVASGAFSGQFNAGTFMIQGPSGTGSVTFSAGDTLNDIANDFNAASGTTGLTATAQTSSTGVYTLAFTNTSTGQPATFNLNSSTYIISDPSHVFAEQTSATYTLSAATNPVTVASGAGSGQFNAGTYTIAGPGGTGTVTLNAGDTLDQIATDFNNSESSTGIAVSVIQTSPGVYQLAFNSTLTGGGSQYDFDLSNTTVTTVTNGSGDPVSLGGVGFAAPVDGQNASFDLNGTLITRPTNTISDLIPGVTLNLLENTQALPGASFTLQVTPDTTGIANAITNFANTYNAFLTFYAQQTALNSNGTPASSSVLYSDTTLRNVYNQLTAEASSIVTGLSSGSGGSSGSGASNQLTGIGISFINTAATTTTPSISNTLSIDSTALQSALQNNLSGVEQVLGYNLSSSSPNLASFQNATDPTVSSFTLNVTQSTNPPTYVANYTDSSGNPQHVDFTYNSVGTNAVALTAPANSALAGLILIYTGTGNESDIKVTTTQGIVAQMNNFLTTALTANTGLIATDQSAISTKNTTLQTQISNVATQVANTRITLLQKFSALESAISSANSTLNLLNATQLASSSG